MTQEEKAKAYDKALEKAKKELNACGSQDCDAARQIFRLFPELTESEDEKIRKELIDFLEYYRLNNVLDSKTVFLLTDSVAWLEKQKDTNVLIQEASEKAYIEGMRVERKHWLEKQGESTLIEEIKRRKELFLREKEKAVSSSEKLSLGGRIAMLEELLVFANEKQDEQKPSLDFKASNWYVSKVDGKIHDLTYNPTDKVEQKPAWSEEDDKRLINTTISFLNHYADKGYENAVECIDWLKSLKTTNVGNSSITVEGMYNPIKDASV